MDTACHDTIQDRWDKMGKERIDKHGKGLKMGISEMEAKDDSIARRLSTLCFKLLLRSLYESSEANTVTFDDLN